MSRIISTLYYGNSDATVNPEAHSVVLENVSGSDPKFWEPTVAVEAGSISVYVGGSQPNNYWGGDIGGHRHYQQGWQCSAIVVNSNTSTRTTRTCMLQGACILCLLQRPG